MTVVKPEYGPTLVELVRPRLLATTPMRRRALQAVALTVVLAAVGALVAWPRNRGYSHGPPAAFSISYARTLHRVAPDPGGYVKLEQRRRGRVVQTMAIAPLRLAPYHGDPDGELPIFAYGYIRRLAAAASGFRLVNEGKFRVNGNPGYAILYTARGPGGEIWGRDILLVPQGAGGRDGLAITMRARPDSRLGGVSGVGSTGAFNDILRNFNLGG